MQVVHAPNGQGEHKGSHCLPADEASFKLRWAIARNHWERILVAGTTTDTNEILPAESRRARSSVSGECSIPIS